MSFWRSSKHSTRPKGPRPNVGDITFPKEGLRVDRQEPDTIEWVDRLYNRYIARVERGDSLVLWTIDSVRAERRRLAATRDGGIVSVVPSRANGLPIVKCVSKFKSGGGYLYEGTVLIRFPSALYSLSTSMDEQNITGAREAAITGTLFQCGDLTIPTGGRPGTSSQIAGWFRDPYNDETPGPILHSLSDDDRLDEVFSRHPLSRLRAWLEQIEGGLTIAGDVIEEPMVVQSTRGADMAESRHRISSEALRIFFAQVGRPKDAVTLLRDALPMRGDEPAFDHPRAGFILLVLGNLQWDLDDRDRGVRTVQWAVQAFETTRGTDAFQTVLARAHLGRFYALAGQLKTAEELLTPAIETFDPARHGQVLSQALDALAIVRNGEGRGTEARALQSRAEGLRKAAAARMKEQG